MLLSSLAAQLITRELAAPAQGWAWAWRIQNEYPAPLREAAEAWVENRPLPNPQGGGCSLEEVMEATGATAPQALELLYVLERSPSDGLTLLARCTRRDRLR
ncbi:hypothetical protein [Pseudoflavonifractor sp.]|jgi:hypothetical protein|uniref:hypothetical protein n=1 Tax=Pseudoflavonifractor sp. TaxID=1980281 RepID=UPI003D8D7998